MIVRDSNNRHGFGDTCSLVIRRRTLLLLLLIFVSASITSAANNNKMVQMMKISPVSNWEPSWVASSVEGTTVAVWYRNSSSKKQDEEEDGEEEGVIMLMRSSSSKEQKQRHKISDEDLMIVQQQQQQLDEDDSSQPQLKLRIRVHNPNEMSIASPISHQQNKRWSMLTNDDGQIIMSMTGLCSDIDYLKRMLLYETDFHSLIYDSSLSLTALGIIIPYLRDALYESTNTAQGGRPFGVQALIVGPAAAASTTSPPATAATFTRRRRKSLPPPTLALWTVDPSGGYRHWPLASAIGYRAGEVRKQLHTLLTAKNDNEKEENNNGKHNNSSHPRSPYDALQLALKAVIKDRIQKEGQGFASSEIVKKLLKKDNYEAVLMLKKKSSKSSSSSSSVIVGSIYENDLDALLRKIMEEEEQDTKK